MCEDSLLVGLTTLQQEKIKVQNFSFVVKFQATKTKKQTDARGGRCLVRPGPRAGASEQGEERRTGLDRRPG